MDDPLLYHDEVIRMCRLSVNLNCLLLVFSFAACSSPAQELFEFRGQIVDQKTQRPIYARVYLIHENGQSFHVETADAQGTTVPYRVVRGKSQEVHTTVSNHVFKVQLPKGKYLLTAEHGKEYLAKSISFEIVDQPLQKTIKLKRWFNAAEQHWYSGEVHIHRKVTEMPTVIQAEDLNVVLPLTYWVTDSESIPISHNKAGEKEYDAQLIKVTPQHVIWPVNTEYEIFSVKGKRHTLGAFFILGHSAPLAAKTPPVKPIADEARRQGALIDLDKHNWPWSMMLIPQMKVDLFELTNNHVWRTDFLFKQWYVEYAPDYMKIEKGKDGGFTPKGWLDFGWQNYYALLNCGFKIMPSGGTASGVHPVPAGFGRVYVHLPNGFSYQAWMEGLKNGRSFVTNGPMLQATINEKHPGETFDLKQNTQFEVTATARFPKNRKSKIELIVNGKLVDIEKTNFQVDSDGVLTLEFSQSLKIDRTSWAVIRCTQALKNGNVSFAHSAPFFFQKGTEPIKPRVEEVKYLIRRVSTELKRHQQVLTADQLSEFANALEFYQKQLQRAE